MKTDDNKSPCIKNGTNPIQELFANKDFCKAEILRIREAFGDRTEMTSLDGVEAMQKTLAMMYLYCPPSMMDHVLATMEELKNRIYLFSEKTNYSTLISIELHRS